MNVARLVDQHRDDDDRADHDELPERLDVEQNQAEWNTAMISAPMTVPMIVPAPPNRLTPPMITAAIEESSSGSPISAAPAVKRAV